jgi:hypothetical protein
MALSTLAILYLIFMGIPIACWAGNDSLPTETYCPVGQNWPGLDLDWFEPGLITGDGQTFAALADPIDGCDCPLGFTAIVADFFFSLPDSISLPFDLTYSLGLKETVADPANPCLVRPGVTICETPLREVPIVIPKDFYGFGTALECPCASMVDPIFVFLTIHSALKLPGALYTDGVAGPATCTFFSRESDSGAWVDMVAAGQLIRGKVVLWATANCCETPIAADQQSWGLLKAHYR